MKNYILHQIGSLVLLSLVVLPWSCTEDALKNLDHQCSSEFNDKAIAESNFANYPGLPAALSALNQSFLELTASEIELNKSLEEYFKAKDQEAKDNFLKKVADINSKISQYLTNLNNYDAELDKKLMLRKVMWEADCAYYTCSKLGHENCCYNEHVEQYCNGSGIGYYQLGVEFEIYIRDKYQEAETPALTSIRKYLSILDSNCQQNLEICTVAQLGYNALKFLNLTIATSIDRQRYDIAVASSNLKQANAQLDSSIAALLQCQKNDPVNCR